MRMSTTPWSLKATDYCMAAISHGKVSDRLNTGKQPTASRDHDNQAAASHAQDTTPQLRKAQT